MSSEFERIVQEADREMAKAVREAMQHEQNGLSEAEAAARLDVRRSEIAAKFDRETKRYLDRIGASARASAIPRLGTNRLLFGCGVLAAFLLLFVGACLEAFTGQGFVLANADAHLATLPATVLITSLVAVTCLLILEVKGITEVSRSANTFKRRFIHYPLTGLVLSALVYLAPPGWASWITWAAGTPARSAVVIISVRPPTSGRGCHQSAELAYGKSIATICLDGRVATGPTLQPRHRVMAQGRITRWGFYIDTLLPQ